jgi:hypothetical protein
MRHELLIVALATVAAAGCYESTAPAAPTKAAPSATTAAPPSAVDVAAKMDTRTPVPLLPMMAEHQKQQMRGHLGAVQEIVAALAKDDFPGVEAATKKIGYSDSMAQMCTHMGAAAPGFTPTAITFHKTADTIGVAAKKKERGAVLAALNATLNTCVGCHTAYKQQIVDEATWSKLTSMAPPAGSHSSGDHASCPMMQQHQ